MSMFEEGRPDSRIALIGEAPSFVEEQRGQPFVGPAGGMLDRLLQAAQIPRSHTYITNVWEVQVVKKKQDPSRIFAPNGETLWWSTTKGFTAEGLEAASGCIARLNRCSANIFVPLGAPALHLCSADNRSISKHRGSIYASERFKQRKYVASFHPSSCLRG